MIKQPEFLKRKLSGELDPGDPIISDREVDIMKLQGLFDLPHGLKDAKSVQKIGKILKNAKPNYEKYIKQYRNLSN